MCSHSRALTIASVSHKRLDDPMNSIWRHKARQYSQAVLNHSKFQPERLKLFSKVYVPCLVLHVTVNARQINVRSAYPAKSHFEDLHSIGRLTLQPHSNITDSSPLNKLRRFKWISTDIRYSQRSVISFKWGNAIEVVQNAWFRKRDPGDQILVRILRCLHGKIVLTEHSLQLLMGTYKHEGVSDASALP